MGGHILRLYYLQWRVEVDCDHDDAKDGDSVCDDVS